MHIYMYIFMKRSFPKHDLRTWHWYCKLKFKIGVYRVLEKSFSYVHSIDSIHSMYCRHALKFVVHKSRYVTAGECSVHGVYISFLT